MNACPKVHLSACNNVHCGIYAVAVSFSTCPNRSIANSTRQSLPLERAATTYKKALGFFAELMLPYSPELLVPVLLLLRMCECAFVPSNRGCVPYFITLAPKPASRGALLQSR